MMDAASMEAKETLLLGDFNIDLLRQNSPWTNLISTYHLRQVITRSTRVTASSESLIDHIYASDVNRIEISARTQQSLMKCLPRISTSTLPVLLTKSSRMIVQHPITCDC